MNKLQKIALFNLSAATAGLLLQLSRFLMSDFKVMRIVISVVILIILLVLVASYIFRHMFVKQGGLHYDERDKFIHKRATSAGFITVFFVLSLACLISLFTAGPSGSINIVRLFGIFVLGGLSCLFAESIAVLVQYGWGGKDVEK